MMVEITEFQTKFLEQQTLVNITIIIIFLEKNLYPRKLELYL